MTPRSLSIPKSWKNFDFASCFAAFIYPALGLLTLLLVAILGYIFAPQEMAWWHWPLGLGVIALSIFICNAGIGPLHRILQHKAGEMTVPGQILTMLNLMIAMQGRVKDWVNYHSQHHRFADKPGDPHNPAEGKFWAWVGWILWRDDNDQRRPMAMWLRQQPAVVWMDRFYHHISLGIHLLVPMAIYLIVWLCGGSLWLTAILHACFVIGRAIQFHATVYGINVLGHIPTPKWADYLVALLTGGESFHDHHHDEPESALHLPRKGWLNRIFDYNGTMLLVYEKLGFVRRLKIPARFA